MKNYFLILTLIILGLSFTNQVLASTLYDYVNVGDNNQQGVESDGSTQAGLYWTATDTTSYILTSLKLKLSRRDTIGGTANFKLKLADDNHYPTGDVLCQVTNYDTTSITQLYEGDWYEIFNNGNCDLTINQSDEYAIYFYMTSGTTARLWLRIIASNVKLGTAMLTGSGEGNWVIYNTDDAMFEVWGTETAPPPPPPPPSVTGYFQRFLSIFATWFVFTFLIAILFSGLLGLRDFLGHQKVFRSYRRSRIRDE